MPDKLRSLSGREVLAILARFGFQRVAQKGSHVKVRWHSEDGRRVTISVSDPGTVKPGTLRSIYRDACRAVPEPELRPLFYAD